MSNEIHLSGLFFGSFLFVAISSEVQSGISVDSYFRHRTKRDSVVCDEWKQSGRITLQLAVFADHALYDQFIQLYQNSSIAKLKLQEFIFSMVQQGKSIFLSSTLEPKVYIEVVEYKVIRHKLHHQFGKKLHHDMPEYMQSFCRYQEKLNKFKHWDHAVLFTGLDLVHTDQQRNIAGFSTSSSICGPLSCSVIEASSFKSAYIFAHEIGHSLGMNHDNGSEQCPSTCCVMAPVVFAGSWNWSKCSVAQLQEYLESIPCATFCLHDDDSSVKRIPLPSTPPGQIFTATDQCHQHFGPCLQPYFEGDPKSVCEELWCIDSSGAMRLAHAALEGTYCGDGKWCRSGKCIAAEKKKLVRRDGGWSPWITGDSGSACGQSTCSKRELVGQLSVKRQIRTCSNPSPNNGGNECTGEESRGVVCMDEEMDIVKSKEDNVTLQPINEFATEICTVHKKRAEDAKDTFITLSGDGFQRTEDYTEANVCFVWCEVVNASFTSYTFFDPFPDGIQCGKDRFCLSGKCLKRHICNSTFSMLTNDNSPDWGPKTQRKNGTKSSPSFSKWSSWSECSRTCGIGVKRRVRQCSPTNSTVCKRFSSTRQLQFCGSKPCSPPAIITGEAQAIMQSDGNGFSLVERSKHFEKEHLNADVGEKEQSAASKIFQKKSQ